VVETLDRNRCADPADRNGFRLRSRCLVAWCQFSAQLFAALSLICLTAGISHFIATTWLPSRSVTTQRGKVPSTFKIFLKNRYVALESGWLCTRMRSLHSLDQPLAKATGCDHRSSSTPLPNATYRHSDPDTLSGASTTPRRTSNTTLGSFRSSR
jgi:hypothetical protein